jgi:hypothetical protein
MVIIYQYVKYSLVIRKVSQNRLRLILFSQGRIQCWARVLNMVLNSRLKLPL